MTRPSRTVYEITEAGRDEFFGLLRQSWQNMDWQYFDLNISPGMTRLANQNAAAYGLQDRVRYDSGAGDQFPYTAQTFVFMAGLPACLHPALL